MSMYNDTVESKSKELMWSQSTGVSPQMQLPEEQVYQKLVKELLFDDSEKVISIALDPTMILKGDIALLRILFEKRMKGIILCSGRPAEFYIKLLRSRGLNPDVLYFIDVLTFTSAKQKVETPNVNPSYKHIFYYQERQNMKLVPHPSDFTAIDVAFSNSVDELVRNKGGDGLFLLIDGIAPHQLYIKPSALGAFIHTIVSKARTRDITTFLFLTEGIDIILSNTIKTFSDKIITL